MKNVQGYPNDGRYKWIRVSDILVPKDCDAVDEKTVSAIAESIPVFGLLHPIAVRRTPDGIVLVAGAHRLEAMKRVGLKKIPCILVEGDGTDAKMVRLGENLFRKTVSVLRRAEGLVEYIRLASARVSGQPVRKCKPGRPPSGIARAARELPLFSRSEEARRKIIERAIKIDKITPEAKQAAKTARLANNQAALLKIAEASGAKAQLSVAAELAAVLGTLKVKNGAASRKAKDVVKKTKADDVSDRVDGAINKTTFDEMVALWNSECGAKWANLPIPDRKKFVEMILRAKCRAQADAVRLLKDALYGREKILKPDLLALAERQGLVKGRVMKAVKALGYKTKRKGSDPRSPWFVINRGQDWKNQLPAISNEEVAAAANVQRDHEDSGSAKSGGKSGLDSYLRDI
jgi:ParB-like chromosome segregation protein Spo0J